MAIEISAADVAQAEAFLATLLTEKVPEGRFTKGTALRDFAVKAFSFIFAQLGRDNEEVRSLQSLLSIQNIATGTDPDRDKAVSDGLDALLSNWFIGRKSGYFSRGVLTVNVTRRQDYILPGNNRFTYDRARAFYPDIADPSQQIVIRAATLQPVVESDGTVSMYQFKQRVVAARTGVAYNVVPATWSGGRQFSSYVANIFNEEVFSGGKGKETSQEMIERAGSAISVRNLINTRSVDATLRDKFSAIRRLLVVGMGEPEMQRDLAVASVPGIQLHLGGHYDIFLELPRATAGFTGKLGGVFPRPDGIACVLRDATVPDWTALGLQVGDNLRLTAGVPGAPRDYLVREVLEGELRVSTTTPFTKATDTGGTFVDYYLFRPVFGPNVQIYPATGVNSTGQTSASASNVNRMTLPGGAHYAIADVAVIDPDPSDPYTDLGDGYVHFPVRANDTPVPVGSADALQYQVINSTPATAQSQIQLEEVVLEPRYNGKTVQVRYETLVGMSAVHSYTRDRFERVVAGNILVRGFIPVYLSMAIPYSLNETAAGTVDLEALRNAVAEYVNNFNPHDVIDVSDITQMVRNYSPNIGTIFPFDLAYTLIVPDGRTLQYTTSDRVSLDPENLAPPHTAADLADPVAQAISDRTVRYLTSANRIELFEHE